MSSSDTEDIAATIAALLQHHFDPVKNLSDEERIIENDIMGADILSNYDNSDLMNYLSRTTAFGAADEKLESSDLTYNVETCESVYKDLYPDAEPEKFKQFDASKSGIEPTTDRLNDLKSEKTVTMGEKQQDIWNTFVYAEDELSSATFLENQADNLCKYTSDQQQIYVQQEVDNFKFFPYANVLQSNTCFGGEETGDDSIASVPLLQVTLLKQEKQSRRKQYIKDILRSFVDDLPENSNPYTVSLNSTYGSSDTHTSSSLSATQKSSGNKKKQGFHECTVCEKKYVYESGLLRHMKIHDSTPTSNCKRNNVQVVVVKCMVCGRIFTEPHSSFLHSCIAPFEMDIEDASLVLQEETEIYSTGTSDLQERPAPENFKIVILSCVLQCEFCDFVFSDVYFLFNHSSCHLPEKRCECMSCGAHLKTAKQLCHHWQTECKFKQDVQKLHQIITQRYFVCNVCENKFASLALLYEHRYSLCHFFPRFNNIFENAQAPCEYCEFISGNAGECLTHYEENHTKIYNGKEKVNDSKKPRPFLCFICGKSYIQSSHLMQHLRFHQGIKPFACEVTGCVRKFTTRIDLRDHTRNCHTGDRPYKCLVCSKRFLTGPVFYQHRLIHRNDKRYNCPICDKSFARKESLNTHQFVHTGETPFSCPYCPKKFNQKGNYARHVQSQHSHSKDKTKKNKTVTVKIGPKRYPQPSLVNENPAFDLPLDAFGIIPSSACNDENTDQSSSIYADKPAVAVAIAQHPQQPPLLNKTTPFDFPTASFWEIPSPDCGDENIDQSSSVYCNNVSTDESGTNPTPIVDFDEETLLDILS